MPEMTMNPTARADILIVDDTPANLDVLTEMLAQQGYEARPVPSGPLALQSARVQPPDLILLDINMPEMNGYEVCKHLKADETLRDVPVIFISALNDTADKVKAFDMGAVDYVAKPFQFEEVKARVETHLRIYHLQKELAQQYGAIRKLEELKDNLTHMIVHDMASPIQTISMALDLVLSDGSDQNAESVDVLSRALDASRNLTEMVNSLLDISRMESGQMPLRRANVELRHLAEEAAEAMQLLAGAKNIRLVVQGPEVFLHADRDLIRRVFVNLIGNAVKFTPAGGAVTISASASDGQTRAEVHDSGCGIPEQYHERIFEKFSQVESSREGCKHSTGLGLTFCKLAVAAHGGKIGVQSRPGEGSTFWFSLPMNHTGAPSSESEERPLQECHS